MQIQHLNLRFSFNQAHCCIPRIIPICGLLGVLDVSPFQFTYFKTFLIYGLKIQDSS